MDCPECDEQGAYRGLLFIHCMNESCCFYDARYTTKVRSEKLADAVRALKRDNFIVLPDEDD